MNRRAFILALGGAVMTLLATAATAESFPTRPIRLVVPYPAGGGTDIVGCDRVGARLLSDITAPDLAALVLGSRYRTAPRLKISQWTLDRKLFAILIDDDQKERSFGITHDTLFASARRPASVMRTSATSILRPAATTRSTSAVASPARMSCATCGIVNPCAKSSASVQPSRHAASSSSARRRVGFESRRRTGLVTPCLSCG
jgi:hypothetical protein